MTVTAPAVIEVKRLIEQEKEDFELNEKYGILGIVKYLMGCCEDPDMQEQIAYIENE